MPPSILMTVPPDETPISLGDVKDRLNIIDDNSEDTKLLGLILSATDYAQGYQWAQYVTATFAQRYDYGFPSWLRPARAPLIAVTSIQYVDQNGTLQTLATDQYLVDAFVQPGRILPAYGVTWPATRGFYNDVILTFTAGYGSPEDVPHEIKEALLMKVDSLHSSCNDDLEGMNRSIKAMLDLRSFREFF